MPQIPFNNTYIDLAEKFYIKTNPSPINNPQWIAFNQTLAAELGLNQLDIKDPKTLAIFAGNQVPKNTTPIAMAYAGHQFAGFNPQLGDGRAILLGEIIAPNKKRYDIQLKGAGQTAFSRNGDGRSALGPVLREYLISEAMAQLGIPTTRALAAITSDDQVMRQQISPSGVLTRIASSYVRIGTFQYFAAKQDLQSIKKLADYIIQRHYAEIKEAKDPYLSLFSQIVDKQARLIAQWMQIGFIHGVMNTDNVSIVGETLDYGPCAFMDYYQHHQVYSSIDQQGRYAYCNQPNIGQWNLVRLAEALLPLFDKNIEPVETILNGYADLYQKYWLKGMRHKLGLFKKSAQDQSLIEQLFALMEEAKADFTLTFYYLSQLNNEIDLQDQPFSELFKHSPAIQQWLNQWRQRLNEEHLKQIERQQKMQQINPLYIPRNHQIEAVIRAAEDHQDYQPFKALHEVLKQPYIKQKDKEAYALPPKAEEIVYQTFCGT